MNRTRNQIAAAVLFVLLLCALLPMTALATPGDMGSDGDYNWVEMADGELAIDGYTGAGGNITVPTTLNGGMPVTEIGNNAFAGNPTITGVVLQSGIKSIGVSAFEGCTGLASATLPSTLEEIGNYAFSSTGITAITLPSGLTTLGTNPFQNCAALKDITFNCGQVTLNSGTFSNSLAIETVTFNGAWTSIATDTFGSRPELHTVVLNQGMQTIGTHAFGSCPKLATINFPSSLKTIESSAFSNCTLLASVSLNEGLETIESAVFLGSGLTSITLPQGLTTLGDSAFMNCAALVDVTFNCGQVATDPNTFRGSNAIETITFVGAWTTVTTDTFSNRPELHTVVLNEGMQTIGAHAFGSCPKLTTINFPSTLKTIETSAFSNCTGLTSVSLNEGLETIEAAAFYNTGLTAITLPQGLTTLGNAVFTNCTALKDVTFDCDQVALSWTTFEGSLAIETITFNGTWTSITPDSFSSRPELHTVVLNEGLQTIGAHVFAYCPKLTTVNFPNTLEVIDQVVFFECSLLENVQLNEGLQTIGAAAFLGTDVRQIVLPSSLTYLDLHAFRDCAQMTKAVVLNPATVFDTEVFVNTALDADGMYGYAGSTAQTYAGANSHPFHLLQIITYNAQGGSDVPIGYHAAGQIINAPAEPTKDNFVFDGWYDTTACDGTPFSWPHHMNGDVTMYAKWTPLIDQETSDIYVGGRDIITPNVTGGTWTYDNAYISLTDNSDGSVTIEGVQNGSTTLSYEYGGVTDSVAVTISHLPTGGLIDQETSDIYVGGRDIITPNVTGGTWTYDNAYISLTDNGDGSVTIEGVQNGSTTLSYEYGGVTDSVAVTISDANMPSTGQDFTWAYILGGLAFAAAVAAVVLKRRRVRV